MTHSHIFGRNSKHNLTTYQERMNEVAMQLCLENPNLLRSNEKRKSPFSNNIMATLRSSYLNFCFQRNLFRCRRLTTNLFFPVLFSNTESGLKIYGASPTSLIHPTPIDLQDIAELSILQCGNLVFPSKGGWLRL